MQLFYTPDIEMTGPYLLSEEESRHCVKVLRLGEGAIVHLVDGKGGLYAARIQEAGRKRCLLEIIEMQREFGKRPYRLHVAIAPTKNTDRFEWFLEKATEAGIDQVTPLICARSERRVLRTDRLLKRITAAMKQSLHAYHPLLDEPVDFEKFISRQSLAGGTGQPAVQKYIAHCESGAKHYLDHAGTPPRNVMVLIGPEGDFTPAEIGLALDSGFSGLSLGASRLRTETAGVAVCFEMRFLNR